MLFIYFFVVEKKMDLTCFEKYINFQDIDESELKFAINYICGNLNANYTLNYPYWYDMYSYTAKNLIVLNHRKYEEGNSNPKTKLGECVCQDKVINFLQNSNKKCFCDSGCSSLRFNTLF